MDETSTIETATLLAEIIQLMPGYVYWFDKDGRYGGCNLLYAQLLSLESPTDIVGRSAHDFYSKSLAKEIERFNQRVMAEQKMLIKEEVVSLDSEHPEIMLSQKGPLFDKHGQIIGVLAVSLDISHIKEMESKLSNAKTLAENSFEKILSLMPGHVYWKDCNGLYLGCNEAQAKAAGLNSREDIVGKTVYDMPWHEYANSINEVDQKILSGEIDQAREEFPLRLTNGEQRVFMSAKAPLIDESKQICGLLGVSHDITERKLAEQAMLEAKERAEAANQAKTKFIANMSHDLRTPLHALLGMAEMLQIQPHYPEQVELIDGIMQSGKSLLTLVEDILSFAKLEAHQYDVEISHFNIKTLLKDIVSTFALQAKNKNIELIIDIGKQVPHVIDSDQDIIRRILLNLVTNALKFTEHGAITISCQFAKPDPLKLKDKKALSISVIDTGIGIPMNKLSQVFDRFYRVDPSYKGKYKGTGLGLAIAKQLAETLEGDLSVKSIANEGTTFTLTLPISKVEIQDQEPGAESHSDGSAAELIDLSVLLVEDDMLAQKVSSVILGQLGCKVDVASSSAEAIAKAANHYDVIFMDIGLPDTDGMTTTKQLHEQQLIAPSTLIYALTAHASEEQRNECLKAGMNGFLVKPARYQDFRSVLKEIADIKNKATNLQ